MTDIRWSQMKSGKIEIFMFISTYVMNVRETRKDLPMLNILLVSSDENKNVLKDYWCIPLSIGAPGQFNLC